MFECILILFLLGLLCPWICRKHNRYLGWLLSAIPAVLFFLFLGQCDGIANGDMLSSSITWLPQLGINLDFYLDGLSELFCLLITGIGTLVVIYSYDYLHNHIHIGRYYAYLFFFMASMLGCVLSNNLITLFIFWELTSLTSYLLICFNHREPAAKRAGLQSLLITAGGGLAMLLGFIIIMILTGQHDFTALFNQKNFLLQQSLYPYIVILILLGAFTKSAQYPFHFWLPNAMQAPTPISALLHSATMVKLGIYLVARFTPILGGTELWTALLTFIGGVTMLTSSILALRANDMKLILAYSTNMALGTLMFLLASGNPRTAQAAMIFLLAHALYKAGLFLCTGIIDHATGTRNLALLGGLRKKLPFTFVATLLTAASMAGLPPVLGFITKETIYEANLAEPRVTALLVFIAFLTNITFFTIGLLFLIKPFFGKNQHFTYNNKIHEAKFSLWFAPLLLGILGLFFGLYSSIIDNPLIDPATTAVLQNYHNLSLGLWHGITPALLLSTLTFICALILFYFYPVLHIWLKNHLLTNYGPEKLYDLSLKILNFLAICLQRSIQSGHLRAYTLTIFITLLALTGFTFYYFDFNQFTLTFPHAPWFGWVLGIFLVLPAFIIVFTGDYFANLAYLGIIGMSSTILFLIYSAPDVAMTQLLVDILTIVIVVMALYRLPSLPHYKPIPRATAIRNAIISLLIGGLITIILLAVISIPFNLAINNFYTRYSYPLAHGQNIVNVIIVDFRSFDTLGEMIVVGLAGFGIYGLLKMSRKEKTLQIGNES